MGSGTSKMASDGAKLPTRLFPLLRLRYEDMRRRTEAHFTNKATSEKELLTDNESHDAESSKNVKIVIENIEGCDDKLLVCMDLDKDDKRKMKEEDDEDMEKIDDGCLFPASPSFRIYYLESLSNIDHIESDDNDGKTESLEGEQLDEIQEHEALKESNDQTLEMKTLKKGRGRKFRMKGLAKVRPVGVKNLLNVRSCYNSACSSHERTHLLIEKPVA